MPTFYQQWLPVGYYPFPISVVIPHQVPPGSQNYPWKTLAALGHSCSGCRTESKMHQETIWSSSWGAVLHLGLTSPGKFPKNSLIKVWRNATVLTWNCNSSRCRKALPKMVASVKKIMVEFQTMIDACKTRSGFAQGSWYGNWNTVALLQDNPSKDVGFLENSIPGSFLITIFDDGGSERCESGKNQCSVAQNYFPPRPKSKETY